MEYRIWDFVLEKIDEDGDPIDNIVYTYNGDCSGIHEDINDSFDDPILPMTIDSAKSLITMLNRYIKENQ